MNPMDQRIAVPIDDPNADTEWNDILRKHKIIPEKPPSPTPMIQEALEQARQLAHENRLEGKDLDELDELEDEEDDDFLDQYRQKRMLEMQTISTASIYNQVYPIQKSDWSREVTEESKKAHVLVLLTGANDESRLIVEIWRTLANKFGDVKFCQIRGDLAIEGYPDRNTPTILIYRDGDVKRQLVTLREIGGIDTTIKEAERMLIDCGAVNLNDTRLTKRDAEVDPISTSSFKTQGKRPTVDSDDSDLDD